MNRTRSPSEYQHDQPEDQQYCPPSQVHIEAKRALINCLFTESAKSRQQQTNHAEEQTDRQTNVQSHCNSYQKIMFSISANTRTATPNASGLLYHGKLPSEVRLVKE